MRPFRFYTFNSIWYLLNYRKRDEYKKKSDGDSNKWGDKNDWIDWNAKKPKFQPMAPNLVSGETSI